MSWKGFKVGDEVKHVGTGSVWTIDKDCGASFRLAGKTRLGGELIRTVWHKGYVDAYCDFVATPPPAPAVVTATPPPRAVVVKETYGTWYGNGPISMATGGIASPSLSEMIGRRTPPSPADQAAATRVEFRKEAPSPVLPTDSAARKDLPLATGCLDYFPAALAAVAELSKKGNDKHNPGQPLHHARGKSMDHADCVVRHLVDRGTLDPEDGVRHSVKVAWRALALLQEELEAAGAPKARGAK